ncbi:hypothetical protein AALF16_21955 [Bacillus cereus]|uniref:LGFP repeat-containing protein n=1 Tax=Bacillus cereus TaxID=1396 RepID=UPI00356C31EA
MANDFVVSGVIRGHWQSWGAASGPFGKPKGPEENVPGRNGSRQRFERGEIGWSGDHNIITSVYRLRNEACFEWISPLFEYEYFRYDVSYNGAGQGQAAMQVKSTVNQIWTKLQGFGEYAFTIKFCTDPTIGADECKHGWTIPVRLNLDTSTETPNPNPGGPQVKPKFAERWHELGAWDGPLGKPIFTHYDDPLEAFIQRFEHGIITTSPNHADGMVVAAYQRGRVIEVNWGGGLPSSFNVYRLDVYHNNKKVLEKLVRLWPGDWARSLNSSGFFRYEPPNTIEEAVYGFVISPGMTDKLRPVLAPNPDPTIKVEPAGFAEYDPDVVKFLHGQTLRGNVHYRPIPYVAQLDLPALDGTPHNAYASHAMRARSIVKHYVDAKRNLTWPVGEATETNTTLLIAYLQAAADDYNSRVPGELPNRVIAHAMLRTMNPGHGQVGTEINEEFLGIKISRKGDYDMTLIGLMVVAYRYRHLITNDELDFLLRVLVPHHLVGGHDKTIESYIVKLEVVPETENHMLMINSTRYLVNQIQFEKTGNQYYNNVQNGLKSWLLRYLQIIAKHDFLEFNSRPYQRLALHAIFNLNEFAKDPDIRTAAQIILDYVSMKFAVSNNRTRRIPPFRRLHEYMNRVCNVHRVLDHDTEGADALTGFFLMYLGPSDRNRNPTDQFPEGWSGTALIAGLTDYRPPPAAYIIAIERPGPYQHRFYHGTRPEVPEADEIADGGVEIYYSSPSFLLSAGGMFLNSGYGRDQFTGYKQVAYAQATTLLPTRAMDAKDRDRRDVLFEELIRFDQYPSKRVPVEEKQCTFEDERPAVNTGVHLGFACGANLVISVLWLRAAQVSNTVTPDSNGWIILNLNQDQPPYGPLGFYVAAYRTPVADPEPLKERYGMVPKNVGFLYVMEATDMPFDEFKQRILSRNTFPDKFEWSAVYEFHTPHDRERVFRFWIRPEEHKYQPRIYELNAESLNDFRSLKLVEGPYLNAPNGHDGFIEVYTPVYTPGCGMPLILDFRNAAQPSRRDNIDACPQPWLDRAQAMYHQAVRLVEAGHKGLAVSHANEAVMLYRRLATISGANVIIIAVNLVDLSSKLCGVGGLCSEAVHPIQLAVDILRNYQPAPEQQMEYLEIFAYTVHMLALRLLEAGRKNEAVGPANEALTLYRRLGGMSGANVMKVARYLLDLSGDLADYGLHSESVNPAQVAVLFLRGLQPQPDKQLEYLELFGFSLTNLARRLQKAERVNEAIISAQEAVTVYRRLAEMDPDKYGSMLQSAEQLVTTLTQS